MSVDQGSCTEKIVFVKLLDEGTDVWRPVHATLLADGTYKLHASAGYDPTTETWEFPPFSRVICASRTFSDGEVGLIAVGLASN